MGSRDKDLEFEEPMYRHLHCMGQIIAKGLPTLESVKGKDVVLLLGPTGSGKSTMANAMISGIDGLTQNEDGNFSAKTTLTFEGHEVYKIGHGVTSCTGTPNYHPLTDDGELMLVDCAGFGDTNQYQEFPNMTMVNYILQNARSLVICFIIKGSSIESLNGARYV